MAGAGSHQGPGALFVATLLAGAMLLPAPALAEDGATVVLPGTTTTAVTADLDGDGEREIIRLIQEGLTADHAVDAWSQDGLEWSSLGSVPIAGSGSDPSPNPAGAQAVALLAWKDAAGDRVLALSAEIVPDDPNGATCCLTLFEVQRSPEGSLELLFLQRIDSAAQSFQTADFDGDGTDELVLNEYHYGDGPGDETAAVTVLRWADTRFELIFEETDPRWMYGFVLTDSDGVSGDDIVLGPTADGRLQRLAWIDDAFADEEAHVNLGGPDQGWVVGVADDTILLSLADEAHAIRWSRGDEAIMVDALSTRSYPNLMLIGEGPDALVGLQDVAAFDRGRASSLRLYDLDLRSLGEVPVTRASEDFFNIVSGAAGSAWNNQPFNLYPYTGPLHGVELDGRQAYAANGMLIQSGGPDGYDAQPMASLIGVVPIGVTGAGDSWVVLSDTSGGPAGTAYLQWGGMGFGLGRVTITPVAELLRPDDEVPVASFGLHNAVELTRDDGVASLLADGDGFEVAVSAAPGSRVLLAYDQRLEQLEVADSPLTVEISPRPRRQQDDDEKKDEEFEAIIVVVGPDGRGITQEWAGTFVREPPTISLTAETDAGALSATLAGQASPGSSVTANGQAIETDARGRFDASIDAPIWPSRVSVIVRDPLGNEATEIIEVVGVVDYRGLPWAGIMVVATIIVGGVLYVRTPKRRETRVIGDGDGRLEELDLDAIEAVEPRGR
ncbi:MAG: hypothetical protein ABIZ57_08720 [Candidatus Limnocylindria bacterium]